MRVGIVAAVTVGTELAMELRDELRPDASDAFELVRRKFRLCMVLGGWRDDL